MLYYVTKYGVNTRYYITLKISNLVLKLYKLRGYTFLCKLPPDFDSTTFDEEGFKYLINKGRTSPPKIKIF